MSLVAFVSGRSPGLTTAVHALALSWPVERRAVLAELDPSGGTLSARHELPPDPGLTNLAAAGRRGLSTETVLRHCRRLPSGVIALVSPVSPDRVASALSVLGPELGEMLDAIPGTDVLADCGRIDRRSPALELVRSAPYVVLVVAPTLEGVAHAQARIDTLSAAPGRLAVMTIGERPYRPDEVGTALDLPVLGALALDGTAAEQLNGIGRARGQPIRRSDLRRSASGIARDLSGLVALRAPAPAPSGSTPAPGTVLEPGGRHEPDSDRARQRDRRLEPHPVGPVVNRRSRQ